jgi:hypothetical protein
MTLGVNSFFLTVLPFSGSKLYGSPSVVASLGELLPRFLPNGQNLKGYLGANPSHAPLFAIGATFLFSFTYLIRHRAGATARVNALAFLTFTLIATFFSHGGAFHSYYIPTLWIGLLAIVALPQIWPASLWPSRLAFSLLITSLLISGLYKLPGVVRDLDRVARHNFKELMVSEPLRTDAENIRRMTPSDKVTVLSVMGDVALLASVGLISDRPTFWCFRNQNLNLAAEVKSTISAARRIPWIVLRTDQVAIFPLRHLGGRRSPRRSQARRCSWRARRRATSRARAYSSTAPGRSRAIPTCGRSAAARSGSRETGSIHGRARP